MSKLSGKEIIDTIKNIKRVDFDIGIEDEVLDRYCLALERNFRFI